MVHWSQKWKSTEKKYKLSKEAWLALYESQYKACAICCKFYGTKLVVDHNHKTGAIRELLCGQCNLALGAVTESPRILLAMLSYLEKWNAQIS